MCEIPQQNSFEQLIYTLKNEGWECKTGPDQGWIPLGVGRVN
jgi:hypothetical protein